MTVCSDLLRHTYLILMPYERVWCLLDGASLIGTLLILVGVMSLSFTIKEFTGSSLLILTGILTVPELPKSFLSLVSQVIGRDVNSIGIIVPIGVILGLLLVSADQFLIEISFTGFS